MGTDGGREITGLKKAKMFAENNQNIAKRFSQPKKNY